jgi:hypothetical protein
MSITSSIAILRFDRLRMEHGYRFENRNIQLFHLVKRWISPGEMILWVGWTISASISTLPAGGKLR